MLTVWREKDIQVCTKNWKKDLNASNYTEMSDYSSLSISQDNLAGVKFRKIKDDAKDETQTILEKE